MIIIILIYAVIGLALLIFHSYQKPFIKTLPKKEYKLLFLFPLSLLIVDAIKTLRPNFCMNRKEKLRSLYVFEDIEVKNKAFMAQVIAYILGVLLLFNTIALIMQIKTVGKEEPAVQRMVARPDYGKRSETNEYQIVVENEDFYMEEDLTYQVKPRDYTEETFAKAIEQAKTYLQQKVLGENTSGKEITKALHLVKEIPSLGLKVSWVRDKDHIVKYDGSFIYNDSKQSKDIVITAVVSAGNLEEEIPIALTLLPPTMTEKEAVLHSIREALQNADESSRTEAQFELPESVDGTKVYFKKESKNQYVTILIIGILIAVLIPVLHERKLKEQLEYRDIQMRMDYPELVNKLVLLLEAGMTMTRAWGKIAQDYEKDVKKKRRESHYAYEEMVASYYELKNGVGESQVYDSFGRRIKLLPYMKLSSLLAQNTSKGMEGLLSYMKTESIEAFTERKELAKRLGEKAGTKMLLPMGLMLGVVLIIIIIPAFTTL